MKMLLNEKTKQEKIMNEVQKKRNLFGLGLTSLIAACSTDAENGAENGATNLGVRPTKDLEAVPLTPVAGDFINLAAENSVLDEPEGRVAGKKNLKITIAESTEQAPTPVTNNFEMTFRNGDHTGASDDYKTVVVHKGLIAVDQYDLIIQSARFGDLAGVLTSSEAIYVVWDIGAGGTFVDAGTGNIKKHLKIVDFKGATPSDDIKAFYEPGYPALYQNLGGEADQADMVFKTKQGYGILWDFTKHATTADEGATTVTLGDAGILTIGVGAEPGKPLEFIKINDNDNYDAIIKKDGDGTAVYIFWDVANYYDANAVTPVVDPTSDTKPDHGLLTIEGTITGNIMKAADEGGFTDIDGNGTNDLAFVYDSNTYILFGEKVANIDEESGKAISHTVDLNAVAASDFYDKDGDMVTDTAAEGGFFHHDLDGDGDNAVVENVGYRFATNVAADKVNTLANIKTTYEDAITALPEAVGLSEEAYWDVA